MGPSTYTLPITLYCVHYDPYYCSVDPEYLWSLIQSKGGAAHTGMLGCVDFYVPKELIALVMLTDSNLKILTAKSYL